eukprot:366518-Chlamydomonas_euryale.AAC.4
MHACAEAGMHPCAHAPLVTVTLSMGALKHGNCQWPNSLDVQGSSAATIAYVIPASFVFSTQLLPNLPMMSRSAAVSSTSLFLACEVMSDWLRAGHGCAPSGGSPISPIVHLAPLPADAGMPHDRSCATKSSGSSRRGCSAGIRREAADADTRAGRPARGTMTSTPQDFGCAPRRAAVVPTAAERISRNRRSCAGASLKKRTAA